MPVIWPKISLFDTPIENTAQVDLPQVEQAKQDEASASDAQSTLGNKAAKAAGQTVWTQALRVIIQLANVVVLARLLDDRDYGVIGMVTAVVGIATIFQDLGLSTAAIRGRSLSPGQQSNLWWINTGAGTILMIIASALSPLLAQFYHEPQVLPITLAIVPTFLMAGMTIQYRADLTRRLRQGSLLSIDLLAAALALIAGAITGYIGWGPWALVTQRVVNGLIPLILLPIAAGWLPRRIDRTVPMREFVGFGAHMSGVQIIAYIAGNLDAILIGRLFGSAPLGMYNRAVQVLRTPLNQFRPQVSNLGLAVLAKMQEDDERTMSYVRRGQLGLGYSVLLMSGVIVAAAPAVVSVALGSEWQNIVPYLRLVAIGEGLSTLALVAGWIFTARGLGKSFLWHTLFSAVIRLIAIAIGSTIGPLGVAYAYVAAPVILWPISLLWAGRASGIRTSPLIVSGMRILTVSTVATVAAWGVYERLNLGSANSGDGSSLISGILGDLVGLLVVCIVEAVALASMVIIIPVVRRDLTELVRMVRLMLHR